MEWFRGGMPLEVVLVRLDAGEELRAGLARAAEELSLGTAVVLAGQGMLSRARLAGPGELLLEKAGPLRIVGLQGTFFAGGLDLTVTLARSGETFAGAVSDGCVVDPTAECALLRVGQLNPARVADAAGVARLQAAGRLDRSAEPITLMGQPVDPGAVALVPRTLIEHHQALPLQRLGDTLLLALADPRTCFALDDFRVATGLQIRPVTVPAAELRAAIARVLARMRG